MFFTHIVLVFLLLSCTSGSPLERIQKKLAEYPEYSIILNDMQEKGTFFKDYYHQYKVVIGTKSGEEISHQSGLTDWILVSKDFHKKHANNLGMTISSKTQNGVSNVAGPPGYQHVGNPRYGRWNQSGGSSFWEFYGKYALMSSVFGMISGPIYRNDHNLYRQHRTQGQPYYGNNRQYGSKGSVTKKTNKNFFARRRVMESRRKQAFSNRVGNRVRRSNFSGYRRRSSGFGK